MYGAGRSERLIGRFLERSGADIRVATKLGRRPETGWPDSYSYGSMREAVLASRERLGVERIFLEQLHCVPIEVLREGAVFDHLRAFRDEGLIERFGASVETSEEALLCLEEPGLASLQVIFNLFRQHVADEVFAKAAEKGVAIIVRVPFASGLLTGKFTKDTRFAESDHRTFNADGEAFNVGETFSGIPFARGVELAEEVRALLPSGPMPQLALRWILDHPEVTTVIPGASSPEQVASNASSSHLAPLSSDTHARLRELYNRRIRPEIRGRY